MGTFSDDNGNFTGNGSFAVCRPININGIKHVVGVSKVKTGDTFEIKINHHTRTIEGNKELPGFKSVSFDPRFIDDIISILTGYKQTLK